MGEVVGSRPSGIQIEPLFITLTLIVQFQGCSSGHRYIRRRDYLPAQSKPVYAPKDGKDEKVFDAFERSVLNQPSDKQPCKYSETQTFHLFSTY
jgi:hypothetical protein